MSGFDSEKFELRTGVEYTFPILFTRAVFTPGNPALTRLIPPGCGSVGVFLDSGVAASHLPLAGQIEHFLRDSGYDLRGSPVILPGGEAAKNGFGLVEQALEEIAGWRLCRHSYVFVVGGGAFLDAIGLAAGLAHRGVRLVRFPTTALAQGDSGVGVKNGVNFYGLKNFAGMFAPPHAVVCDLDFLAALPVAMLLDGVAEAFKVALIKDAEFFAFLESSADAIAAGSLGVIEEAVARSARLHAEHIAGGGDPFELGGARPLDFGHWAAHKLEAMSGHRLRHGEAVAVGLALDLLYARHIGLLCEQDCERALTALHRAGLCLSTPLLRQCDGGGHPEVFHGINEFREHLGGALAITLPSAIGARCEVSEIDLTRMAACIDELLRRHPPVS